MARKSNRPALSERRLARLNWMEMGEWVPRDISTVLVPVGTLEAHGILSLGTDNEIPARLAEAVAERLNALIAPTIPYGVTAHLGALAGGTHVPVGPFTEYAAAVLKALAHQGFRNVIVMNGHGGNTESLKEAARGVHEETGGFVAVLNWWTECYPICEEVLGVPGGHAARPLGSFDRIRAPELLGGIPRAGFAHLLRRKAERPRARHEEGARVLDSRRGARGRDPRGSRDALGPRRVPRAAGHPPRRPRARAGADRRERPRRRGAETEEVGAESAGAT